MERPLRAGFPAPLPLNPDGSAPEHPDSAAGLITDPLMWRTSNRQAPEIEFDYRKMAIKVDTRGLGKLTGTLQFSDLEKLPRVWKTYLLQCGAANPRGIVEWTGVRFTDFADMLGLVPGVHYARFVASDRMYTDEAMDTLRHPQVMLAWLMNAAPHSAEARRAVAARGPFPLREPEHQGDHRDDVRHPRSARPTSPGLAELPASRSWTAAKRLLTRCHGRRPAADSWRSSHRVTSAQ